MNHGGLWATSDPKRFPWPPPDSGRRLSAAPKRNRILVIEDDPIVSLAIESLLSEAGYVIAATCARGEDAAGLAARYRPDLILADVKLTGAMNGVAAVAAIQVHVSVPVIFVTAHVDPQTREQMEALEPADILAKPVPDHLLLRAVTAALRD